MRHRWFDGAAISASGLCLAHCLLLPVFLITLPSGVHAAGGNETFHIAMLLIAIPMSLFGLFTGSKAHGNPFPLQMGFTGLLLLALGAWLEHAYASAILLTVIGSFLLIGAHVANWRLRGALNR